MDQNIIVGIDEVGRGCLWGPVVVAGVILNPECDEPPIKYRDSKKLTKNRRELLNDYILDNAFEYKIVFIDNNTIDEINILNATMKGMHKILDELYFKPDNILVDGNYFRPYKNIPYETIEKGDDLVPSISAASIIAKVARDTWVEKWAEDNPSYNDYDLSNNKGYGTQKHINGLYKYGYTPEHRKSFKPISNLSQRCAFE